MAQSSNVRTALQYIGILAVLYIVFGNSISTTVFPQTKEETVDLPVSQDHIESLVYPDPKMQCPQKPLDVHIFSNNPLIIYIPTFLSDEESQHMIEISEHKWTPSTIFNNGVESSDDSVRKSEKAMIDRDSVVQCIEQRALSFQGWPKDTFIERLWTQRYTASGHYAHHYDWASEGRSARRTSTFMVYLQANCTGGGTNFPLLERPADTRWCEFVDCTAQEEGVTFLPRTGSAVFWENFDAEGRGWKEGLHAGMPVESGVKIGLNIWSWYQKGHQQPAPSLRRDL